MNNDPASLTDPNGLKVGESLTMMGKNTGPPMPLWVASWMDKEWIGILSYLVGGRMGGDWNGGSSGAVWQQALSAAIAHGNGTRGGGDGAAASPINIEAGSTCNYSDWIDYTNMVSGSGGNTQDQIVEINYTNYSDKVKTPEGNYIEAGVEAQFGVINGSYNQYQWYQSVTESSSPYRDAPKDKNGLKKFFYFSDSEIQAFQADLARLNLSAYFFDRSSRDIKDKNVTWDAKLTLVGRMNPGDKWTPITTIDWGWKMVNGIVTKKPWTLVSLPHYNKEEIKRFNADPNNL